MDHVLGVVWSLMGLAISSTVVAVTNSGIDPGSVFLIIGAVIFAVATWRTRSVTLLREENADYRAALKERDAEITQLNHKLSELESQVRDLKLRDSSVLIAKLAEHDERSSTQANEITKGLVSVTTAVQAMAALFAADTPLKDQR